ncbi:MAG TPA: glycosyl transferase [Elusimicrobia bacterium]|nr:glycosyl transferase [Elusimicrobiota bacterium]HBT61527.1 glycosyl transferase [Elusimicrobiota bacterium]
MKLSIIIPAYNEEKLLPACLASVREALGACAQPELRNEIIVCDNNSTDATARIAQEAGAKVAFEPVNLISRSRNAGAAAASGDWLLFIDADSRLSASTLKAMLEAAQSGTCAGGGSLIDFDDKPWWGAALLVLWSFLSRAMKWAAGSFVFCRKDAFDAVGGFPPELAAGEELGLSRNLKRWGRRQGLNFVILRTTHVSSGRKFHLYSPGEFLGILLEMARSPKRSLRDPGISKHLYDGRR